MLTFVTSMKAAEAYVVKSTDGKTLTFYYDNYKSSRSGTKYSLNTGTNNPGWWPYGWWESDKTITTVVFNSSFVNARPTTTYCWFLNLSNLKSIQGIQYFNTQNVTNMSSMFSGCSSLTNVDVTKFNTQNVTNMSSMFSGCSSLTNLDVTKFNTQNVTSMSGMFYECSSLSNLNLINFDTQNVTNMTQMFQSTGNSSFNLNISKFNTQNVTNMFGMFQCCNANTIDVSSFNTHKVTNMTAMFNGCNNITSLDLTNFDTQNVTNMFMMFAQCDKLMRIDISNFNTKNVTDMSKMFSEDYKLNYLDVSNFNTQNVIKMYGMFESCSSLNNLDVSNFDTHNVTQMAGMFSYCSSLTSLDLRNFDFSKTHNNTLGPITLHNCSSLKSLSISSSFYLDSESACRGIGTPDNPCYIYAPRDYNFGVDTSGDWFLWHQGYFTLNEIVPEDPDEKIIVPNDYGYMTYCSEHGLDFTGRSDIKAYIIASYDGNIVYLSRVTTVPPETGLVLKAAAGTYLIPIISDDSYVVNMLKGVLVDTTVEPTEGTYTNFLLANGNNGLGFYRVKQAGTLAAHRAYLQLPTRLMDHGAKYLNMVFDDETTSINGVMTQEESTPYYDLQGVRHDNVPTKKGIYIHNGKKVVVK